MFTSRVTYKRIILQGIPALLFEPLDELPKGRVIHYHGWGSRKENHSLMASALAASGFEVLVPDALCHGERGSIASEGYEGLPEVILANLKEFPLLASFGKGAPLFLSGHSMGSMSAGVIFHQYPLVKAAAILNGYLSFKSLAGQIPRALLDVDPTDFLEGIGERHLLILHGEGDSSVDIQVQRDYVKKAREAFLPGHLVMEEYPRLDHWITLSMLERTLKFFLSL